MANIQEPTCFGCPYDLRYNEVLPTKKKGVVMHFGERFCTAGKRARRFKRSDPKVKVPDWCPKRKYPREMRIYGFKHTMSWLINEDLSNYMRRDPSPEGRHYALEFELTTPLSPREFLDRSQTESDARLVGVAVHRHHVVEIDDGVKPVFFYKTREGYRCEPYFDAEQARANKRKEPEDND